MDFSHVSLPVVSIPEGYGIVEPGIFRAKSLDINCLPFVSTLALKTLLHLSPSPPLPAIVEFLGKSSIRLIHLEGKSTSWKPMSEKSMKDALEIVLDASMYPIMITCTSGVRKTGLVVGCLRKLQKWNLTSIVEEYRRYASNKPHYAQEQFVELFDENLVTLPRNLVPWFADQQKMMDQEKAEFRQQLEDLKLLPMKNAKLPLPMESCSSYERYYYQPSCPLTTEDRYRKQRSMRKT